MPTELNSLPRPKHGLVMGDEGLLIAGDVMDGAPAPVAA
jgi:hypothetical protein